MPAILQMMAAAGAVAAAAPDTVTLGTPTGAGIPWTLPALPAGATALTLQVSLDGVDWHDRTLAGPGGTSGTFAVDPVTGGAATGLHATQHYFRAYATPTALTGEPTETSTVGLPSAPGEPFDVSSELLGNAVTLSAPSVVDDTTDLHFSLEYNVDGGGWTSAGENVAFNEVAHEWDNALTISFTFKIRFAECSNIYGPGPAGAEADVPLLP